MLHLKFVNYAILRLISVYSVSIKQLALVVLTIIIGIMIILAKIHAPLIIIL
jgi:hypothetical protein